MLYLLLAALLAGCELSATDALAVWDVAGIYIGCSVALYGVGEALKRMVPKSRHWFCRYYWQTLPAHPVGMGFVIGLLAHGWKPEVLLFMAAGQSSTWLRALWRTWLKHKGLADA